jgi:hypothetical protein
MMQRKWGIALVVAALAAVVAATVLSGDAADFAWGLAAGLGIGGVIAWFAERGG